VRDALIISALSVLPKKPLARLMGKLNRIRWMKTIQKWILQRYISWYQVNAEECEGTLDDYPSLAEFFVRALKPGARPIDSSPDILISPVDGRVYSIGTVKEDRIPQSPKRSFSVSTLLGGGNFDGCFYAVLYLSPKDYHRVHAPRSGKITRMCYQPGNLWPVFPAATQNIDNLFAQNERLTSFFETDQGNIALVMVGAFGVGRMRVVYDALLTNEPGLEKVQDRTVEGVFLERGAELGRFEMGSTVILVLPPGNVEWLVQAGEPVKLGMGLARFPTGQ
jgi:phosphatidylserine decarboxylase